MNRFLPEVGDNSVSEMLFLNKNRTMDDVHKRNICINVPSSQTFTSYL
jgi:hypothetical protein